MAFKAASRFERRCQGMSVSGEGRGQTSGVIDIHAHHVSPDGLAEMARIAPKLGPTLRKRDGSWTLDMPAGLLMGHPNGTSMAVPDGLVDMSTRLAEMDRQGVQYHALRNYTPLHLAQLPGELAAELHAAHNDAVVASVRAAPDRLVALPTLPLPHVDLAANEVRRLAAFPEVAGIGISTSVGGVDLDDERLDPVWKAIDAVGLPVLLHPPGTVAGEERMGGYHLANLIGYPVESAVAMGRIIFSGLLDRWPNLRFCFVHGGGYGPYQLGRWDHGWRVREESKTRISRPPSEYINGRCFFDSLTHDPIALRFLGARVGWDHVMLGSDYPWSMATTAPLQDVRAAKLEGSQVRGVVSDNARVFLRWPADSQA